MSIRIFFICSIAFLVSAFPVAAKDTPTNYKPVQKNVQGVDPELREKINFARQLIKDKNYEGASAYLETLYEVDAGNPVIINLLKQCYTQLKLYTKLEDMVQRQISQQPDNLSHWISLAEVTAKQGNVDDAIKHYRKAASLIQGENNVRFQILIQSMLVNDFESDAEKMILQWRKEFNQPELLAIQMGQIFERQKLYANAVGEYFPVLFDTTRIGNDAEKRVMSLLLFEDSAPIVERFLLDQENLYSNERAVKILSTYYLRSNKFEDAFEFTKHRDSLEQLNGNALIQYMQNCNNRKLYQETIRMGDYLTSQYEQPVVRIRGQFMYAEALIHLDEFDRAKAMYDEIFATATNNRDKTDALFNLGKLYQEQYVYIDHALLYFDSIATHFRYGIGYLNTLVEIPYCYLQKGDLAKAEINYTAVKQRRLSEEIKEKVDFYLATIKFLNKQVDSSRTAFSKLIIDYPLGFYVNDALEMMKIIDEGKEAPSVLYDYAGALFFEMQNQPDSVIARLDFIAGNESKVLADFALFKLSSLLMERGDTTKTISYIDQLSDLFPDSYYLPYGLKQKADIYLSDKRKADEAKSIYLHLLETYPNYPFISEIREILRKINTSEKSA